MTKPSLRKTGFVLGVAIALAAGSAEAYTPNDVFLANNSFADVTTSGLYSFGADIFHFTLSSASNISVAMSNLPDVFGSNVSFAQALVETPCPGYNCLVFSSGAWISDAVTSTYSFSLSNLAAADYTLKIWGYAPDSLAGTDAGSYRVALGVTSPAPEPGEWAMLLAGLGLVGVIARRRRQTN